MPKLLINILNKDRRAMMDLINKHRIEIVRQTARARGDGREYSVDALIEADQLEVLRDLGFRVVIKESIEEIGIARQAIVGKGNRFVA
jgi:hypothetical protein